MKDVKGANKSSDEIDMENAIQVLLRLQSEHGVGNPFYIARNKYTVPAFLQILDQIRIVEEAGLVTETPYVPPWIDDGTGHRVLNTKKKAEPNVMQLNVTPKAEQLLKSRTITRTETVTEIFQQREEPVWKQNKRLRDFGRTERGHTINMMSPEALASDVQSHIHAIRGGDIPRKM